MHTFFKTIPSLAYLFSNGSYSRCLLICIRLWFVLVISEVFHIHVSIPIVLQFKNTRFTFSFTSKADISVCKEVFLEEEYKWELKNPPHTIIDLGAHVGDTALYYHALYPNARIYAVEPDPISFERLQKHVQSIPEIIPVQLAISSSTGTGTLYQSSISSLRGSLLERKSAESSASVPLMTLDDFYKRYDLQRVDLIKFDIEGAEKDLFGTKSAIAYADAYIGEVHCDLAHIEFGEFASSFEGFELETVQISHKNRFNLKAKIKLDTI